MTPSARPFAGLALAAALLAGCGAPGGGPDGTGPVTETVGLGFLTQESGAPLALRFSSHHPVAGNCTLGLFASAKELPEGPFQLLAAYTLDGHLEYAHLQSASEVVRFHAGGVSLGPADVVPGGTHSGFFSLPDRSLRVQGNLTVWLASPAPGRIPDAPVQDATMAYSLRCDEPFTAGPALGGAFASWMPPGSEEGVGVGVIPNGNVESGSGRTVQADGPLTLALLVVPGGTGAVAATGPGIAMQRDLAGEAFFGHADGGPGEYAVRADRVDAQGEGGVLALFAALDRTLAVEAVAAPPPA